MEPYPTPNIIEQDLAELIEAVSFTDLVVFGRANYSKEASAYPCYAYLMAKRFGKSPSCESWIEPLLVSNTLELLDKEMPKIKGKIESVHLCFTTDPFMLGYEEVAEMSLAAIKKLNGAGIKCTVLTKGLLPLELGECSKDNEYGITLVSLDEDFRKRYEPGAAPCSQRLSALEALSRRGCKTWVSMEPYPTPNIIEQDMAELIEAVSFTDSVVFGRANYSKDASAYPSHKEFYKEQAISAEFFCDAYGIRSYIKKATAGILADMPSLAGNKNAF
jgi:DNA repair photolyase